MKIVLALLMALAGGITAYFIGANFVAMVMIILLCALCGWLILSHGDKETADNSALSADQALDDASPAAANLVDAVLEPVILAKGPLIIHANRPALDLLGAHIMGEDVRLAIRNPLATEVFASVPSTAAAGVGHQVEIAGLGGLERRWTVHVQALGAHWRLINLQEVTSRYVAEKMRVDFVANASHELRTPLAALLGFIETLGDDRLMADGAKRNRFLQIMEKEARRMDQLVSDLISLSRIEAARFIAPEQTVDLAPLVREVAKAISLGSTETRKRLKIDMPEDPVVITGDKAQISQVLHNLVGNALKYGGEGSPVAISVGQARPVNGQSRYEIVVTDSGEGIAPEHLPRLTERFYRVDAGRSRSMGGTGLGLAIVKHIVERHRGELEISSKLGVGTSVKVILPRAPEALSLNRN